ncbi:pentapeptide repeat-containing protein [Streptomyces parvulus]|uniref:pentapeptide repeat-containing protein n=1 Tax=Streptomyces parvulus TaxID=146923 RepID=UPI001CF9AA3C|nr:pentapeptide repeat-containing protein [Streptomyces parvulus]
MDGNYINTETLKGGTSAAMAALITGLRTSIVGFTAALGAGIALLYTARTYRLTRRGQITERFTKALERLGSDEVYVRIGGILALEQIVRDAPEQAATDAARVLGHYIRERAPKADPDSVSLPQSPAADVQEALTALTRPASRTHVDPREPLDLRRLHLAGAHLAGVDLTRADLTGATLTEANLIDATLTEANLERVNLTNANLLQANLTHTNLDRANLTLADLDRANLTKANLTGANLTMANLIAANLVGAFLIQATLTEATLLSATLTEASLTGANLTEANLMKANLLETSLTSANLTKADLTDATLTGAFLMGATLTEAVLFNVSLWRANLEGATLTKVRKLRLIDLRSAATNGETELPSWFYPRTDTPAASD